MRSAGHLQDGPTASRPTYLMIQVLRAIAALMVVAHHATILLRQRDGLPVANWLVGAAGVDIFFIISGFVMTVSSEPLRNSKHPARTFLARRLERIVPLYWLMTTLKIVMVLGLPALAMNELGGWRHVVDSYLFLPGLMDPAVRDPVVVVGWTLDFEMAFYALFAIALAVRGSLLKIVAPVLILVALLTPVVLAHPVRMVGFYVTPLVLEFLFGILLAKAVQHWGRPPVWISAVLLVGGFGVLFGVPWGIMGLWRVVYWGLPAFAIVTGGLGLERKLGPVAPRWLLALGDASYSIYLVHTFVLPLIGAGLMRFGTGWPEVIPVSIAVIVMLSAAAGWVLYRVVELPIMRYFKGRRRTAIPAVA